MPRCCWPECHHEPESDLPLCVTHYREVGLHFIDHNTVGGRAFGIVDRQYQRERDVGQRPHRGWRRLLHGLHERAR